LSLSFFCMDQMAAHTKATSCIPNCTIPSYVLINFGLTMHSMILKRRISRDRSNLEPIDLTSWNIMIPLLISILVSYLSAWRSSLVSTPPILLAKRPIWINLVSSEYTCNIGLIFKPSCALWFSYTKSEEPIVFICRKERQQKGQSITEYDIISYCYCHEGRERINIHHPGQPGIWQAKIVATEKESVCLSVCLSIILQLPRTHSGLVSWREGGRRSTWLPSIQDIYGGLINDLQHYLLWHFYPEDLR
jgi:hypothetical protein